MMNIREASMDMVDRLKAHIALMDADQYAEKLEVLNGSSVGDHFRHIIDFYLCIGNGLEAGLVSYDNRERDILISQCPLYASGKLNDIRETIAVLDPEKSLLVAQSFSTDKSVPAVKLQTTVGRELMYAYDHAVHHMAIIAIGIRVHFSDLQMEEGFGLAPSTIRNLS